MFTFVSKQICHSLRCLWATCPQAQREASCHCHHGSRWERQCPVSPHCYLWVPHHRVSGQRASGGIGSVSQLSLNKESSGGSESTVRGGGRAEAPQGSACKVSQGVKGAREHAQGALGACQ